MGRLLEILDRKGDASANKAVGRALNKLVAESIPLAPKVKNVAQGTH
jgi:hypothetical protein